MRIQRDPIAFGSGDINMYRYCQNDPVNNADPKGTIGFLGAAVAIIAVAAVSWAAGRIITAYVSTRDGGEGAAATPLPYIHWSIKSEEYNNYTAPGKAVVDSHEAIHQSSIFELYSEANAYRETIRKANELLQNGWNGRSLTAQERQELLDMQKLANDYLKAHGICP